MSYPGYSNVPAVASPTPCQERIYRGDELTPGNIYTLISTRQTKKLKPGTSLLATMQTGDYAEGKARTLVETGTGALLHATGNDIFSRWE